MKLVFVSVIALTLGGCAVGGSGPVRSGSSAQDGTITRTGTLRGGVVAIGGETTGWRLTMDRTAEDVEVDVSAVREEAGRLEGRRVTVEGRMEEREFVERGPMPVLVAERLGAAQ